MNQVIAWIAALLERRRISRARKQLALDAERYPEIFDQAKVKEYLQRTEIR